MRQIEREWQSAKATCSTIATAQKPVLFRKPFLIQSSISESQRNKKFHFLLTHTVVLLFRSFQVFFKQQMILFLKQFLKWKGAKIVDFPLIFIVFEMTSGFVSFDYSSIFRLANDAIFRSKKKLDLNLNSIHDNFVIYQKIRKNSVKLCLHSSYTKQNSFHFDEIYFNKKLKRGTENHE